MDDRKFLQLIQKYPAIYNSSHEDFRKKEKWNSAWQSISKEMKVNVPLLIKRWRHIRASLLQDFVNPNKKSQYYLRDSLDFYLPYMRSTRLQNNPYKIESDDSDTDAHVGSTVAEEKINDLQNGNTLRSENGIEFEFEDNTLPEENEYIVNYNECNDPLNISTEKQSTSNPVTSAGQNEEVDYEKSFLLSLCPDFKDLDAKRRRKFRTKVTQLLSDLHEEMSKELEAAHVSKKSKNDSVMWITSSGEKIQIEIDE